MNKHFTDERIQMPKYKKGHSTLFVVREIQKEKTISTGFTHQIGKN